MNSDFIVAVHAMIFLHHKERTVPSDMLAENICTHPSRVRQVMAKLKKAGLVETVEGRQNGGYSYPQNKKVTLGDVSRALNVSFAAASWRSGHAETDCRVSSGMAGYIDNLYDSLNRCCEEYLDKIDVADAETELFK